MRELLLNNITLLERLAILPHQSPLQPATQQREISSLLSWVCAYATYVVILADSNPEPVRGRLAYLCNIVSEAAKIGGDGWHTHDYVFQSQAAINPDTDWSEVSPSLMMAFLSGSPKSQSVQLCSLCHEPDHQDSSCALAPLSQSNKCPTGSKSLVRQHSPPQTASPSFVFLGTRALVFSQAPAAIGMNVVPVESPTLQGAAP